MPLKDKTVLTNENAEVKINDGAILLKSENNNCFKEICAVFSSENTKGDIEKYKEDSGDGREFTYIKANLSKDISLNDDETIIHVCSGAAFSEQECFGISKKVCSHEQCIRREKQTL